MNLSQFWKHMVAIWSYVLPPKLYEAITLFIPAFLVPDQVDVVLMFCQLQPSTPQSRSIPWWRLLKFKYTYLSVDFYISPSKMAHSSQAPKGARGYCKSGLFVLKKKKKPHQNGHQEALNSGFPVCLFLAWIWPSSKEAPSSIRETPVPPTLAALKLRLLDARDLSPCISSHPNRVHGPPQGSECSPSGHLETGKKKPSLEKLDIHVSILSPDLCTVLNVVTRLVFLTHLQGAFFSQLHPCLNSTVMSLLSLGISTWFPNKGKRMAGPGGLAPF